MSTRERRGFDTNSCFFITTTFKDWLPLFVNDEYYELATDSLNFYGSRYNADLICYCLMPNHVHFILFFNDQPRCSDYMRDFKKYMSGRVIMMLERDEREELSLLRINTNRQRFQVWKSRFHASVIRNKNVLVTKLNYIHNNPVRKKLVDEDWHWKYSSAAWYRYKHSNLVTLRHGQTIV